jgi:hypothetical protein
VLLGALLLLVLQAGHRRAMESAPAWLRRGGTQRADPAQTKRARAPTRAAPAARRCAPARRALQPRGLCALHRAAPAVRPTRARLAAFGFLNQRHKLVVGTMGTKRPAQNRIAHVLRACAAWRANVACGETRQRRVAGRSARAA